MSYGEKIKQFREQKGISQTQLAEMVKVSQPMITQIERGTKSLSVQLGKEIAHALGVDIMEIIGREA